MVATRVPLGEFSSTEYCVGWVWNTGVLSLMSMRDTDTVAVDDRAEEGVRESVAITVKLTT